MSDLYLVGKQVKKIEYSFTYDVPSDLESNTTGDAYLLICRNHLTKSLSLSNNLLLNKDKHLILHKDKTDKYFFRKNISFGYKFNLIKLTSIHTNFIFDIMPGYSAFCFPCIIRDIIPIKKDKIITINKILPHFILKGKCKNVTELKKLAKKN